MTSEVKTTDLYIAGYLHCLGNALISLEPFDGRFAFVFSGNDCEQQVNEYWRGGGDVIPKSYADSIKMLKNKVAMERGAYGYRNA